jgi:phage terminase small subunit
MALTDKQESFVQWLVKGKSQREAYKLAGYKTDAMTDDAIDQEACKLLKNPKVYTRHEEIHSRLLKEAEDECIVSAKEVLRELKHIAFDDIRNYLSFRTEKQVVAYDEGKPVFDYRTIVEVKDSDTIDTRNISEVSVTKDGFKFKQYCKDNALVQLGKHLKLFTEKVEHSGSVTTEVKHDLKKLSPEELKNLEHILAKTADTG